MVTFTINPKTIWYDGTPITWQDLLWQWKANNGANPDYKMATAVQQPVPEVDQPGSKVFDDGWTGRILTTRGAVQIRRRPPLSDKAVRHALAEAIDRGTIGKAMLPPRSPQTTRSSDTTRRAR